MEMGGYQVTEKPLFFGFGRTALSFALGEQSLHVPLIGGQLCDLRFFLSQNLGEVKPIKMARKKCKGPFEPLATRVPVPDGEHDSFFPSFLASIPVWRPHRVRASERLVR